MSNPFLTNIPWAGVTGITGASGATYATGANAWSGQLMNVQPAANFFTPSGPIAAENLNYMFNQRDNALIWGLGNYNFQGFVQASASTGVANIESSSTASLGITCAMTGVQAGDLFLVMFNTNLSISGASPSPQDLQGWVQAYQGVGTPINLNSSFVATNSPDHTSLSSFSLFTYTSATSATGMMEFYGLAQFNAASANQGNMLTVSANTITAAWFRLH